MYKTSSTFRVSCFRHRVFIWTLLAVFSCSFAPSTSFAQQPTATIKTLSGDVLVSGQAATGGTILQAGDTIQTQAGASVVLELSDGSELHLGENTQITLTDLAQTSTGARVSRVKLLWGRIRAFLSPQHQIEGSSFDIETPNALIGVKFSEPDVEVSYSLEKAETVGIAHTVELLAKNLLTNEKVLVPVGSSVIITTVGIKVAAGIVGIVGSSSAGSTGTGTASTTTSTGSSGMGTGTKVAIGVGAAAAAGGVAALAFSSGDSDNSGSTLFTGTFKYEEHKINQVTSRPESWTGILNLTQNETTITGDQVVIGAWENCCSVTFTVPVTGTVVDNNSAVLSWPSQESERCECSASESYSTNIFGGTFDAILLDNGRILNAQAHDYIRQ